jgi:hypothetical protein
MISDETIERSKKQTLYGEPNDVVHEHNDCIRIAYEWLDAQAKTKMLTTITRPLKHMIEKWAGRYVSTADVEVAAFMHSEIRGTYPHFNISARLTEPSKERLADIQQAFTQDYNERHNPKLYAHHEQDS